jgi:hypothetical protein
MNPTRKLKMETHLLFNSFSVTKPRARFCIFVGIPNTTGTKKAKRKEHVSETAPEFLNRNSRKEDVAI